MGDLVSRYTVMTENDVGVHRWAQYLVLDGLGNSPTYIRGSALKWLRDLQGDIVLTAIRYFWKNTDSAAGAYMVTQLYTSSINIYLNFMTAGADYTQGTYSCQIPLRLTEASFYQDIFLIFTTSGVAPTNDQLAIVLEGTWTPRPELDPTATSHQVTLTGIKRPFVWRA